MGVASSSSRTATLGGAPTPASIRSTQLMKRFDVRWKMQAIVANRTNQPEGLGRKQAKECSSKAVKQRGGSEEHMNRFERLPRACRGTRSQEKSCALGCAGTENFSCVERPASVYAGPFFLLAVTVGLRSTGQCYRIWGGYRRVSIQTHTRCRKAQ